MWVSLKGFTFRISFKRNRQHYDHWIYEDKDRVESKDLEMSDDKLWIERSEICYTKMSPKY